ncbi:hypothetical protein [Leucobacter sp. cx-169]|uniref:hypothetical protein n=1 Tax=Leucobacter sp. cx-169 TaxID=2770549 RepID=UPI00165E9D29|nr:hypothetical protein [Leucobacter sp. cx-169]MBC9927180.1 hypothetical protein [Leucobacter sp. cx-169]
MFGFIGAALVAGLIWMLFPVMVHEIWQGVRASWVVLLVAVVLIVLAVVFAAMEISFLAFLAGVGAVGWLIFGGMGIHFQQMQAVAASVTVVDGDPNDLSFRERAPYDVAKATSSRTLGNTTGDATGIVRALPARGDTGEYTTSVVRRGLFQGYESTQVLTPPLFGSASAADVRFCKFDERATLRFGGLGWGNDLKRAIAFITPLGTRADQGDAFVTCDGDTPMVYAPLTKQVGAITHRVPAGVAVYNGSTGKLSYYDNLSDDLPLYPQSIATAQRESSTASEGFWDWMFKRSGFEDTGKDTSDPNGSNRAEFGLANDGGINERGWQSYVTPLNSRGSSSSLVGLGTVNASHVENGVLNPYSVHLYPEGKSRQANSAVADAITGGILDGYKASGLKVFEIVPAKDCTWVASIGKAQSILYRASIAPNGDITLIDGSSPDEQPNVEPNGEQPAGSVDLEKPLDSMTVAELNDFGDAVLAELAARAAQK